MTTWRKSTHSGGQGGTDECVELARLGDAVGVRDSKHPNGPVLTFGPRALATLISDIRAGRHLP